MDTSEVIIEKVIENRILDDELENTTSNIEKSNDVTAEKLPKNDDKSSSMQCTNEREVIILDAIEMEQVCNKNGKSEPESSSESSNIVQNEIPVNNGNVNHSIEDLKEKDDDVCIVHEESATSTQKNDQVSSLGSIAVDYGDSDSETEDVSEQAARGNNKGETLKEIQMQPYRQTKEASSSEESDSEDDSTSSSDSSVIAAASSESDSDDSSNKKNRGNNARGQKGGELKSELDDLPPIEDLKISVPEVLCDPLGEVAWMVEQLVVVKPKVGKPTLNLDTVLFVDRGKRALGKIFDVFGQVNEPHYCVRFNSSEHIKECDVNVGMTVYYCPNTEYTSLVFLHELMKLKGIDANADEPPEFSDDEEERVYYTQLKAKQASNATNADVPCKRKRTKPNTGWQSNHPWNRTAQRQRRGFYPQTDRQFATAQTDAQSQALWSQLPYQNPGEPFAYNAYSLQPVEYVNQNFDSYGPHNYYNEDGGAPPLLTPRIPFGASPRIPAAYLPFQGHSNSPAAGVRFQNAAMPWLSSIPQIPVRMRMPWVPLPPPPPPPPASSESTDPS